MADLYPNHWYPSRFDVRRRVIFVVVCLSVGRRRLLRSDLRTEPPAPHVLPVLRLREPGHQPRCKLQVQVAYLTCVCLAKSVMFDFSSLLSLMANAHDNPNQRDTNLVDERIGIVLG